MSAHAFDKMRASVTDLIYEGYPLSAVLAQLHDETVHRQGLKDLNRALICEKIAEVNYRGARS